MQYTVYVLLCADSTYHVGATTQLAKRLDDHANGSRKESYTYHRLPVKLVYHTAFDTVTEALNFQHALKAADLTLIEELIAGQKENWVNTFKTSTATATNSNAVKDQLLALPTTYFGSIGYYAHLVQFNCVLNHTELFRKQTLRSRCTILSANGLQNLIVPVLRPSGKNTETKEVKISYAENWQKNHLKAIESAYRSAPFYEHYSGDIQTILEKQHVFLVDLNNELIQFFQRHFQFQSPQMAETPVGIPIQNTLIPKNRTALDMPVYHQVFEATGQFETNLSILDLLFAKGPETATYLAGVNLEPHAK